VNHLAHCALSMGEPEVMAGNLIGDDIKGNDWQAYPVGIQRGMLLHRRIDAFTDSHPESLACVHLLRPMVRRFAGPVCDILFDHLLATDWSRYNVSTFDDFVISAYQDLESQSAAMPLDWQARLPKMIAGDFMRGYLSREGLEFVFSRFERRLPPNTFEAKRVLDFFYVEMSQFRAHFESFYPSLQGEARTFLLEIREK
jgi:acyl carrier protein phosphodiesterase